MDIDEFIRARLDEREQAARDAGFSPQSKTRQREWTAQPTEWPGAEHPFLDGVKVTDRNGVAVFIANGASRAVHAALHDPVAVLADIAAKRAILAELPSLDEIEYEERAATPQQWRLYELADLVRRQFTAPYSAHPDYNPTWAL